MHFRNWKFPLPRAACVCVLSATIVQVADLAAAACRSALSNITVSARYANLSRELHLGAR
jgi:hypothetical protein